MGISGHVCRLTPAADAGHHGCPAGFPPPRRAAVPIFPRPRRREMMQATPNRCALAGAMAVCVALVIGSPASAQKKWADVKGQVVFKGAKIPPLVKANVNKDTQHCLS